MSEQPNANESPEKKRTIGPARQALLAAAAAFSTMGEVPPTYAQGSVGGKVGDKSFWKAVEKSRPVERSKPSHIELINDMFWYAIKNPKSSEHLVNSLETLLVSSVHQQIFRPQMSEVLTTILNQGVWNNEPDVMSGILGNIETMPGKSTERVEVLKTLVNSIEFPNAPKLEGVIDDTKKAHRIRESYKALGTHRDNLRKVIRLVHQVDQYDEVQAAELIETLMRRISRYTLVPIMYELSKDNPSIAALVETALHKDQPPQSLGDIHKVHQEDLKNLQGHLFFTSEYWVNLSKEEREQYFREYVISSKHNEIGGYDTLNDGWNARPMLLYENPHLYQEYMQEYAEKNPDAMMRAFCFEEGCGHQIFWEVDRFYIEVAMQDARTNPITRVTFWQYVQDMPGEHGRSINSDIIASYMPAPEALVAMRNHHAKVGDLRSIDVVDKENAYDSIYDDPTLGRTKEVAEHFPPDLYKEQPKERAKWITMATRNLFFRKYEGAIDAEIVNKEIKRIEAARTFYDSYKVFGEETLIVGHEEVWKKTGAPRFATDSFIATVKRFIGKDPTVITPHKNRAVRDYQVTAESLRTARANILKFIQEGKSLPQSHLTLFIDGHGGGKAGGAFYLSDGKVVDGKVQETSRTQKISAQEVVNAFAERYKDANVRQQAIENPSLIIASTCSSSNIIRTVLEGLQKLGLPLPVVFASAEFNQYGWSNSGLPAGGDFNRTTILQEKGGNAVPTIGGAIQYGPEQEDSAPVIMVPDPEDKSRPMQIGENENLPYEVKTSIG